MSSIHGDVYSAACNPPRQVKRSRTSQPQSRASVPVTTSVSRPILPRKVTPVKESLLDTDELDEEDNDDSDYEEQILPPPTSAPIAKRRGRKPGTISRSTRDSLRKQNHSRIEKARRTKINDALDTLRTLVPEEYRTKSRDEGTVEVEDSMADKKAGRKDKEPPKEFKLEVLVRTVAYMKDLIAKVQDLEGDKYSSREDVSSGLKRKRDPTDECEEGQLAGKRKLSPSNSQLKDIEVGKQPVSPVSSPSKSPSLPSISSWLPQAFMDPSFLASHSSQLPSPPLSGTFCPRSDSTSRPSSTVFPLLSLPSPMTTLITTTLLPGDLSRKRAGHSPEDESAASMLLHMKSSPTSKGNIHIQTPASVLGLEIGNRSIKGS